MNKLNKFLLKTFTAFLIFMLVFVISFFITPYITIGTYFVFASKEEVVLNERVDEIDYIVNYDLPYESKYLNNTFDIYKPNTETLYPTIIWIYSSNFFFGDKSDLSNFIPTYTTLDFNVVVLNFERGYYKDFRNTIEQIGEAYTYIVENAEPLNVDVENIFIAGSNSGATIASQFVNSEYNIDYADSLTLTAVNANIEGLLLFYGLGEVKQFSGVNEFSDLFYKRLNWQYYGDRNWLNSDKYILNNLDGFPRTYITEANNYTYIHEGKRLANALREKGNDVITFFPDEHFADIAFQHNYYLHLTAEGLPGDAARVNYYQTIKFLTK